MCRLSSDIVKVRIEEKFKGKGVRKCRICGNSRALIRAHRLHICRRCLREVAANLGFKKYG